MTIFHHDADADLQGAIAIPMPLDDVGPTYDGPHFVSYDRANEGYTVVYTDADSTVYSDKSIGI